MIYMAAGNSRRFGSNKLFYPIDGKPMYRHVLERLAAICERHSDWEIVLVSQYEELLEQGRPFAHRTVFSPESRDGASWTIKNGLKEADDAEAFDFLQQISPGLARKLWKDLSAKWKNSMQTWAVSAMVKRPVIQSGFPVKYSS